MSAVKVSTLIGPALDWAVAKCEGETQIVQFSPLASSKHYYAPSRKWAQGGPIIEWEIDQISRYETYPDYRADRFATDDYEDCHAIGPTMLIAAMRCYVASKLGDEVDIPEELL